MEIEIQKFILVCIANAFAIYGLYWAMYFDWKPSGAKQIDITKPKKSMVDENSKMILWFVRYYAPIVFGKKLSKPIALCPVCMASIHSTYWYLPMFGFDATTIATVLISIFKYGLYMVTLAGFNATIISITNEK
jgi:hypothetical protein